MGTLIRYTSLPFLFLLVSFSIFAQEKRGSGCPVSGTYKERHEYYESMLKVNKFLIDASVSKIKTATSHYQTKLKEVGLTVEEAEKLAALILLEPEWTKADQSKALLLAQYSDLHKAIHNESENSSDETCKNMDLLIQIIIKIAIESKNQYILTLKQLASEYKSRQKSER